MSLCYHCGTNKATLKCADCDSEIFRFCSNDCGRDAHPEHSALCYNRNNIEDVQNNLYDAIEGMQSQDEVDDAMKVATEIELSIMIGDENTGDLKLLMNEAHEIIQSHLNDNGPILIEALFSKKTPQQKADAKAKRATARALRRRKAQSKAAAKKERLSKRRSTSAERKQRSDARRAQRYARRQERAARKQARYANRAQNPAATAKPGLREKFYGWNEKRQGRAADREEQRARDALAKNISGSDNE
jgi:hypothetical protein